jgi:hypothetical protein
MFIFIEISPFTYKSIKLRYNQQKRGCNMGTDWHKTATKTLKVELARADIGYDELIKRLAGIGITESYTGVAAKINRGTFSFMFFAQCMKAIGKNTITLD